MRIISQDGALDVPYENILLRKEHESIHCYLIESGGFHYNLATYSNLAKVDKIMDMLHEEYARNYRSFPAQYFGFVPPKIFKFPSDDDVVLEQKETHDAET